jgi:hypothetical protein
MLSVKIILQPITMLWFYFLIKVMCYYAGLRDPVYNVATDNIPNIVYKATISSVRNITESGSDSHQTTYCNQIWKVSPKRL